MTFTYDLDKPGDRERIRYALGDTDAETAIYSDEEIAFVLSEEGGSVGKAVISLIVGVITRLSHEPDMTADWLRVDWRRSSDHWWKLLNEQKQRFGLGAQVRARGQHVYRPDVMRHPPRYRGDEG